MRLIGVDFGSVRIGVAVSDELGFGAYPKTTLARSRSLSHNLDEIVALATREGATAIVFGLPLNADGSAGPAAIDARDIAERLAAKTALPVYLQDEYATTSETLEQLLAMDVSRKRRRDVVDKLAAARILERFLKSDEPSRERANARVAPASGEPAS